MTGGLDRRRFAIAMIILCAAVQVIVFFSAPIQLFLAYWLLSTAIAAGAAWMEL
jgi:hypothetical protein